MFLLLSSGSNMASTSRVNATGEQGTLVITSISLSSLDKDNTSSISLERSVSCRASKSTWKSASPSHVLRAKVDHVVILDQITQLCLQRQSFFLADNRVQPINNAFYGQTDS
jgi:hypothetical protein